MQIIVKYNLLFRLEILKRIEIVSLILEIRLIVKKNVENWKVSLISVFKIRKKARIKVCFLSILALCLLDNKKWRHRRLLQVLLLLELKTLMNLHRLVTLLTWPININSSDYYKIMNKKPTYKYLPANTILPEEGELGPLVLGDCNSAVDHSILKPNKVQTIISIGL